MGARELERVGRHFHGYVGTRSRGGNTTAKQFASVYSIEGEALTLQQVADRLGLSTRTTADRLKRERVQAGPVTWQGLRA